MLINETKIISKNVIREKLLRTLAQAYQKAPYYKDIMPIIKNTIMHPSNNISEALVYSIKSIAEYLNIKTDFLISSQIKKDNDLRGKNKVIHICKLLKVDEYYNAIGGMELYDKIFFSDNNIKLSFVRTGEFKYNQFNNDFIPNLSIIDVMMFNSKEEISKIIENYSLI
jgi:putative cell wall-binding protein